MSNVYFCPFDGLEFRMDGAYFRCNKHGLVGEIAHSVVEGVMTFSFSYEYPIKPTPAVAKKKVKPAEESTESNTVDRPGHYNQYTGFEVMDICRQLVSPDATPASTWFRGNVFKYLARAGWKSVAKELEDLKKAHHYLEREMARVELREGELEEKKLGDAPPYTEALDKQATPKKPMFTWNGMKIDTPSYNSKRTPLCPTCFASLQHDIFSRNRYFCEKGHGTLNYHPNVVAE